MWAHPFAGKLPPTPRTGGSFEVWYKEPEFQNSPAPTHLCLPQGRTEVDLWAVPIMTFWKSQCQPLCLGLESGERTPPMRQLLPAPRSWLRTTGWYGFVSCPSILLVISLNNGQEIWQVWRWDWSESLPVSAGVCQCLPAQAAECKRGWLIGSQKPVLGYLSLSILWWCWGNSFCSEAELPLTATLWNHVSLKGFLPPKLY